ncbi:FAD-dependent oxidoreductase [Paeniglutamicibacter sp. ZC-3]|uniref:NAD(P)/FAD-dependent oxidoreductase n=1 Tax=Paeniglutamicibacter sp. ZC-3 TaxID=2986919 RepID=UPI0021F746CB|nr:FAD-dependent oxidoreductase [Paeniglutamicibacter sp. ZC-3]MCV9993345.1 FAD-dependent oxidoreductase [Paeniglutamicibacter sp. ZC-3]
MPAVEQHPSAVIIGAGHAGVQAAESLRESGWAGRIVLIGEERHAPYQRPPLSKDYLAPGQAAEPLPLRAASFFEQHRIELRVDAEVASIDRRSRSVQLSDGEQVPFSKLVIATGASNRMLDVPGSTLSGIVGLKTLDDAVHLRGILEPSRNIVVVGAGFIGLEFASAARAMGKNVTVLEFSARPMSRALSPAMGDFFARQHLDNGVGLRLGEGIASFSGDEDGNVVTAVSTSGARYPADLVVVGVGVAPNISLAQAAGLEVENGIVVDHALRTLDPDIYAVGDCASFPNPSGAGRIRLESVQNATDQAKHAAHQIVGATEARYEPVPWFWSIQGGLRLQIAGLSAPGNNCVLRGEPGSGRFSVFCFDGETLVAVESVNKPADHVAARKILDQGTNPTPEQCGDTGYDLKSLAKALALAE